jgi:hypothetical protein
MLKSVYDTNNNGIVDNAEALQGYNATSLPISEAQQVALNKKVNISDIKDNVTSSDEDKPLSANQGRVLQSQIDSLSSGVAEDRGEVYNMFNSQTTTYKITSVAIQTAGT